ncbi:MAG TPA: hypothetical protein VKW78_22080 [Terriglobales bacterium]|nr:hypothetical protein [Terriglobales bacterium]
MDRQKHIFRTAAGIAVRVVIFTVLFTLLAFAVGLLCGILASAIYGVLRGVHPDMTMAYRFAAIPLAAMVLVISFVAMLTVEIRRTRRLRPQSHS